MSFALAPDAIAAGYGLAAHGTIGSTSTEAMERLRAGEPGPLWIVSAHQTQGRGRRGSAWQTEPGNLAASLGLITQADSATIATLGFVAGVALVGALERVCPSANGQDASRFRLKWPNDVLADGAKLAGILLETESLGQARAVVIGIGVNVVHAPEGLPYPAESLGAFALTVTAEDVFAALSYEWVRALRLWDEGRGFGAIRDLWLARAAGVGGPISVRSAAGVVAGTFQTIDGRGQLVLRTEIGEVRTITAGEVHFDSAATARQEAAA
jgi:BirA family biotin operon repressor/biotin-[acetyl-CoA-carboxylase] ligase